MAAARRSLPQGRRGRRRTPGSTPPAATTIPGKGIEALHDEMQHYRDLGYSARQDEDRRRAARRRPRAHRGGAARWSAARASDSRVDVNGRFDLDDGARLCRRARSRYGLRWYEEPLDPLDYAAARGRWPSAMRAPIATGENLFSMHDARNLIRHGGLRPDRDILQFDPALSYGLVEYLRTLDDAEAAWLVAAPLRAAWRPPVRAQHRGRPRARRQRILSRRSSRPSAASPTTCPVENSRVRLPDIPGIGFEAQERRSTP